VTILHFDKTNIEGAGIGLRSQHYQTILSTLPSINWFEVLTENYFGDGGLPLHHLEKIREHYPITLHGVGMSLGAAQFPAETYLTKLKRLIERFEPAFVSDHLAWVSVDGKYLHELLPLPYTKEALQNFVNNVDRAQTYLGRQLLIENPASYLGFNNADMQEWEFLLEVVQQTGCELLIDVNNIYVSANNHGFDAHHYIDVLPADKVREIHLAGYEEQQDYLFDTHGQRIHPPVWQLYQYALKQFGPVPSLIEWDTDIPSFDVLLDEANKANRLLGERA
jgi:uncharacterized protein